MNPNNRLRIAALSTFLFVGGIAAGGFGTRAISSSPAPKTVTVKPRTQVIHKTRVRTIHIKPKRKRAASPPPAASAPATVAQAPVQTQPVVQQAPSKVVSRTSPAGGGGGEGDGGGEHEGGGDD